MMKLSKDKIKFLLKLAIGAALIGYVLHSKMIDFEELGAALLAPKNFLAAMGFLSVCALLTGTRWYLLVRAQGLSLSYMSVIQLTMIGLFFNTFMPGAVGGDLIKAWYVAGREPTRKTKAIFTVLLDRVMGLSVFFFYAGVALLFYSQYLADRLQLKMMAYSIWGITAVGVLFTVLFFTPLLGKPKLFQNLISFLQRNKILGRILEAGLLYRHHLKTIIVALILSCVSITSWILFAKVQSDALGIGLPLSQYFFIVPIALTVSAIPILPGGIGVGQVAFFTLFQWVGVENPALGGTLCTVLQIYTIFFNCLGAFFYLRFKRKPGGMLPVENTVEIPPESAHQSL